MLRGLSQLTIEAGKVGIKDEKISVFTCEALFATLTNVNFDPDGIIEYVREAAELRELLRGRIQSAGGCIAVSGGPVNLALEKTKESLIEQGRRFGVKSDPSIDPDLHSLQWLLTYGLKGVAAYTYHAFILGKKDDKVFDFIHQGLAATLDGNEVRRD
jgi:hydroxylamine reductase